MINTTLFVDLRWPWGKAALLACTAIGSPVSFGMPEQIQTVSFWRGVLPHWEVVDGRYFVTVRLANSLPRGVAQDLAAILADASEDTHIERSRQYFRQLEHWLDKNHGAKYLRDHNVAKLVMDTITKYEDLGYWRVMAATVMPNHIHLFFRCESLSVSVVMKRFKKYTAREANRILNRKGKRFWQREWFDHWSRSQQEDDKIISYTSNNPVRAGLVSKPEDWPWTHP